MVRLDREVINSVTQVRAHERRLIYCNKPKCNNYHSSMQKCTFVVCVAAAALGVCVRTDVCARARACVCVCVCVCVCACVSQLLKSLC
jgi:hypothetical protein